MQENVLIHRALKGKPDAQKALYDKYRQIWFMICLRYCRHHQDALDVLQNALVKIFSKLDQFDENKGNFKAWSSKIVVNENLMYIRKKQISFQTDELSEQTMLSIDEETPIDRLSAEMLMKMIHALPEGYRIVFNMYVLEGYSHKEIAGSLGISEGTSKSQLFKAKKLLKNKLEVIL